MITTSYDLKDFFFDRLAVKADLSKKTRRLLNHAGGFVRTVARRSMRSGGKKGKSSDPGQPPRYHSKDKAATLRNILYGFDPATRSVIVGPVLLNGSKRKNPTIPALHEYGGSQQIQEKLAGNTWRPVGRKKARPGQPTRRRKANYPARPYMRPAMEMAAKKFPAIWYGKGAGGAAA